MNDSLVIEYSGIRIIETAVTTNEVLGFAKKNVITSNGLKEKYDTLYSDSTEEWRRIGAIGKVENIIDLTRGLSFNKVIDIGAGDGNILSLLSNKKYKHFNSYGHINIYTPALFNFLLYTIGFDIIKRKYALYKKEVITFQTKRFQY